MYAFGKCGGGGRRKTARAPLPLAAILSTISRSWCAAIVDLSTTGVQLRGPELPAAGELLEVKIESLRVFGTVIWSRNDTCGVAFEEPLLSSAVGRLRVQATAANLSGLTLDQQQALDDWLVGFAR